MPTITRIFCLKLRLVHHFPCHLHQLITHSTKSNCPLGGELAPPHLRADLHFDSRNGPSHSAHPAHALSFLGWCSLLSPLSETFLPSFLSPTKAGCVPILSFRPGARRREHHVNETLVCAWGALWRRAPGAILSLGRLSESGSLEGGGAGGPRLCISEAPQVCSERKQSFRAQSRGGDTCARDIKGRGQREGLC